MTPATVPPPGSIETPEMPQPSPCFGAGFPAFPAGPSHAIDQHTPSPCVRTATPDSGSEASARPKSGRRLIDGAPGDQIATGRYARYRAAVRRLDYLQWTRKAFLGRAIHNATWEQQLLDLLAKA